MRIYAGRSRPFTFFVVEYQLSVSYKYILDRQTDGQTDQWMGGWTDPLINGNNANLYLRNKGS